ncbi:hypothetical protein SDC9_135318 [bioreactor metagenome]|uniref:Uncharacterized protein n=1 Tax=bioreactor metagenome TaxID=1076179 RepID=A0A645DG19_9ZZZZ
MEEVEEEIPQALIVKLPEEIPTAGEKPVGEAGEGGKMRDELGAASRGNILPRLLKQRDLPPAGQGPRDKGDAGKKHRGKDHEDHYFFIYH